jgi:hypothetical protein
MMYFVTHGGARPGAAGIDPSVTLAQALDLARDLLLAGEPDVAIQDGHGRNIRGDDLVACCNGKKTLLPDLSVA